MTELHKLKVRTLDGQSRIVPYYSWDDFAKSALIMFVVNRAAGCALTVPEMTAAVNRLSLEEQKAAFDWWAIKRGEEP
jgi:hypothetical protein